MEKLASERRGQEWTGGQVSAKALSNRKGEVMEDLEEDWIGRCTRSRKICLFSLLELSSLQHKNADFTYTKKGFFYDKYIHILSKVCFNSRFVLFA